MASQDEILETLKEVLVDRLKVDPDQLTPEANFFDDLGLDSIDLMTAVMAVEEKFAIEVSDKELEGVTTLKEAVVLLSSKVSVGA